MNNKFNNQNNDTKKPFVSVDINKLQTGINLRKYIQTQLKYNPDLDPYQLEHDIVKEFDFDFVKNNYKEVVFDDNNQYVFECDTVWMYKVYDLFMLSDFGMYIPYQKEDTAQYDIRRFYLKINDKYAPIFIEKDHIIFEHKLFGLSDEVANEIACYIINNQDNIYKHIDNNTVYDNIKSLPNLIPLSSEPDIYKTEYFNNGKYCIVINSESKLYNVIDTTTHEYMFDDWFIYISVVPPLKMITLYKDDLQYNVDFDLKKIK